MFGYLAALNQPSCWNSLSRAGTLVFTLLTGIVTSTDEFAGLALSTLMTPWMSLKFALGVENQNGSS